MKKWGIRIFLFNIIFLFVFACSFFSPSKTISKIPTGRIIFQSDMNGNYDLFSFDLRSKRITQLTDTTANETSPAYISYLDQIGYSTDEDELYDLAIINLAGEITKKLKFEPDIKIDYPDWSPDGKSIIASMVDDSECSFTTCEYDIYVMDSEGKNYTNLTNTYYAEWVPEWSPDGEHIAFVSVKDDAEIFTMDKDGSNLRRLTNNYDYDGRPKWSPDGKTIAFETDREGGDWDIFLMNADGSNQHALTTNRSNDYSESWSPDGNWIAYVSDMDGDTEILIIDKDGKNQKRLTYNYRWRWHRFGFPDFLLKASINEYVLCIVVSLTFVCFTETPYPYKITRHY
jgi:TolB protein